MKNYNVKDILLSFKKEYLEYGKMLNSLKEEVYVEGEKNLKDFNFYLEKSFYQTVPELKCIIDKKERKYDVFDLFGPTRVYQTAMFKRNNEMAIDGGNVCIFGESDRFKKKLNLLFNSEFTKNIYVERVNSKNNKAYLEFRHNLIRYNLQNKEDGKLARIEYKPVSDEFELLYGNDFTKELIEHMLYSDIMVEELPLYHQNIIKENNVAVEVMDLPKRKKAFFEPNIEFEPMELVKQDKVMVLRNKARR